MACLGSFVGRSSFFTHERPSGQLLPMHGPGRIFREKLAAEEPLIGQFLAEFSGPAIVNVLARAGFDFVMIDCEHGNYSFRDIETMLEAGWNAGICMLVRTADTSRSLITKALDAGAAGIVVPAIDSLEQVRAVVRASKYRPIGRRGVHLFRGHTRHRAVDPQRFMEEANHDLLTFVQIELAKAVEVTEEIAATDGVDGVYIGPGDLSSDLGIAGQWDAPQVTKAMEQVITACRKHRKIVGCHADDINAMPRLGAMGIQMFGFFCDIGMFATAAAESVQRFRRTMSTEQPGDSSELGKGRI